MNTENSDPQLRKRRKGTNLQTANQMYVTICKHRKTIDYLVLPPHEEDSLAFKQKPGLPRQKTSENLELQHTDGEGGGDITNFERKPFSGTVNEKKPHRPDREIVTTKAERILEGRLGFSCQSGGSHKETSRRRGEIKSFLRFSYLACGRGGMERLAILGR